jgi:Reverse transcriptase (RNA-dependent DNA polymerase)
MLGRYASFSDPFYELKHHEVEIFEEEPCVYIKISGSVIAFLILYVDDILLMGNDILSLRLVKSSLKKVLSMKDLDETVYILDIKIYRDRSMRLIGLSQNTYIDKVLNRFSM